MLKEKLLEIGLVVDNEYLDRYCNLIESCKENNKIKNKTHRHHIIPQHYYKSNGLPINSNKENIVNLFYKEHILAHYFLCLCSEEKYKFKNEFALNRILGFDFKSISESDLYSLLDKYQDIYEDYCIRNKKMVRNRVCKPVSLYLTDGTFVKTFNSSKEVASSLNIGSTSPISDCCRNKSRVCRGYIMIYVGDENTLPERIKDVYKTLDNMGKRVCQYDLYGNFIKEYSSISEASKENGFKPGSIISCCKNRKQKYKNYIWCYKGQTPNFNIEIKKPVRKCEKKEPKRNSQKGKPKKGYKVIVYDKNTNEQIGKWISMASAAKDLHVSFSQLANCCYGYRDSVDNYVFKFDKNVG